MFYWPSAMLLTVFLVLGVELELQFLNDISLFAKLLNSLAFCYINDHDLFYVIVFQYVLRRKQYHRQLLLFFAPALAGRHRRASFRPFVRPSIRQHLTWVSCERNSSYSFAPIVLKLCMCFPHGMRMCM